MSYISLHAFRWRFSFLPITFYKMCWYFGAHLDGVIGCGIAMLSYDKSRVCILSHMMYNEFDRSLTIVCHVFFVHFVSLLITS